jgi:hypothetical protein
LRHGTQGINAVAFSRKNDIFTFQKVAHVRSRFLLMRLSCQV